MFPVCCPQQINAKKFSNTNKKLQIALYKKDFFVKSVYASVF